MKFNDCFSMIENLVKGKKEKPYITLRYEMSGNGENQRARISCYSDVLGAWTAEFQSYEDVIRDVAIILAKKPSESPPE